MRVFLAGATGFIGGHLLRALVEHGHGVTCLARPNARGQIDQLALPGVTVVAGTFTQPDSWLHAVAGHDVVINAVGIIREGSDGTFADVHTRAPEKLFAAARAGGVQKIVQISALGADDTARTAYHLSKRAADLALASLGVPYVVLRPSFVYGEGDKSMTFFQSLAALPVTLVPGDGLYRVQPVHIDDVVRAVVRAVEDDCLRNVTVDVGGKEALTFDDLLDTLARRLGKKAARKIHVPWPVMSGVAWLTDASGGRGPITRDELAMLRRGSVADNRDFINTFGFEPVSFQAGIARKPFGQAERWQARLRHLRVPLRLSVAFIWLVTGLVCATVSAAEGLELLGRIGIHGRLASFLLYGTSLGEVALGLATAAGWRVHLCGRIQIALILAFSAILTLFMPHLWWEPFGPLTKNVPLVFAILAMMALED